MDREAEIIKDMAEMVKILNGIQNNIENLLSVSRLLKDRIEKAEQDIICLKEAPQEQKE